MSELIKIPVTQEHIDKGVPFECNQCAISKAIADYTRADTSKYCNLPLVSPVYIEAYNTPSMEGFVSFPDERVGAFICDFDRGIPVQPFTLVIDGDKAYMEGE